MPNNNNASEVSINIEDQLNDVVLQDEKEKQQQHHHHEESHHLSPDMANFIDHVLHRNGNNKRLSKGPSSLNNDSVPFLKDLLQSTTNFDEKTCTTPEKFTELKEDFATYSAPSLSLTFKDLSSIMISLSSIC